MPDHCIKCFWNYNCPLIDGDELTEEEYDKALECDDWQETVSNYSKAS